MARVYRSMQGAVTRYLDVAGSPEVGYEIHRQIIGPDDESETWWRLTPKQSRALRAMLEPALVTDELLRSSDLSEPLDQL